MEDTLGNPENHESHWMESGGQRDEASNGGTGQGANSKDPLPTVLFREIASEELCEGVAEGDPTKHKTLLLFAPVEFAIVFLILQFKPTNVL